MEATYISINRGMDKKDVVYIYTMEAIKSHKKEQNWVISRDVDGPTDCHTEWNDSEKISYINA